MESEDKRFASIASYGIILLHVDNNQKPWYLIHQRRDSFDMVDVLRGNWQDRNLSYIFSLLTPEERQRISTYSIEELWTDLWVDRNSKVAKDGWTKATKKFQMLKDKIPHLIETTKSTVDEAPWGFPKGKKISKESFLTCALREFEEETRIPAKDIQVLPFEPLEEHFTGSNGRNYSTYYYIATIKEKPPIVYQYTPNLIRKKMISEEANDLKWVTLEESKKYLCEDRVQLLRKTETLVSKGLDCLK